jgi:hypothetical protein
MGQADAEHPTQGRLPDRKLDWQPSAQLLDSLSSLRSLSNTDPSPANGVVVVGDVPRDAVRRPVPRTTARCIGLCGLIACFGACTVMLGREVLPEGSVSAIAAPLRLNSIIAVNAMAIARFEKKRDEDFIVMSLEVRGQPIEEASYRKRHCDRKSNVVACKGTAHADALPARRLIRQRMAGISSFDRGWKPGSTLFFAATAFPKTNDSRGSAVR